MLQHAYLQNFEKKMFYEPNNLSVAHDRDQNFMKNFLSKKSKISRVPEILRRPKTSQIRASKFSRAFSKFLRAHQKFYEFFKRAQKFWKLPKLGVLFLCATSRITFNGIYCFL